MNDYDVTWRPTRPEFVIEFVRATSSRCYHESWYQITSRAALNADDLKRLDACCLLGIGQAFYLEKTETIEDEVPPVSVNRRTGLLAPEVPPVSWRGEPMTNTQAYQYQRYTIKRICDSGD